MFLLDKLNGTENILDLSFALSLRVTVHRSYEDRARIQTQVNRRERIAHELGILIGQTASLLVPFDSRYFLSLLSNHFAARRRGSF